MNILANASAREINYADKWDGNSFLTNQLFTPNKLENDQGKVTYSAVQKLLMRLEEVIAQKKAQPGSKLAIDEVTAIISALFGPNALFNPNAGGSDSSSTDPSAVFTSSSATRTRRPQKYKYEGNCKNKPTKHSSAVDEEDKAQQD